MLTLKRVLGAAVAGAGLVAALAAPAMAETTQFAKGTVNANGGVNARIAPSVHATRTFGFKNGTKLGIDCQTKGTIVGGKAEWYLIAAEGSDAKWVSAKYIKLTSGKPPRWCGADDKPVIITVTKKVDSRQGPTTSDTKRRTQQPGTQAALCYVFTASAGRNPWVVTLEDGWIPATAVKSLSKLRYCNA